MRHKQQRLLAQNIQHLETYIKDNNLDISPEEMILSITEADPDWQNFKNSKWLIKNLLNKNFLWEDIEAGKQSKAFDTLSRFLNIRKQWSESSIKDIQAYKGLSGIAEAIRPFEITKSMGELKREEKAQIYSDTIVVYDKNDYLIVIPKTEESSCFWGRNTEWCTASTKSTNYFDAYNPDGPLIICITPDNKKYQFHINSEPMDENDKPLKNITDPILVELALLTGQINSIKHIDYTNPRHAKLAIQNDGSSIQFILSDAEGYSKLCKLAVQNDGYALRHISSKTKGYAELCKIAVQNNEDVIEHISPNTPGYSEICKLAVQNDGLALEHISPNTKDYSEICKLAVQNNGLAIKQISFNTKGYSELCKLAVQNNGYALRSISPHTPGYFELCQLAVQQKGGSIQFISSKTEGYLELCKMAIQNNGLAITYIPSNTPDYIEFCKLAFQQNGYALGCISADTPGYLELCKIAVQNNGDAIQFILSDAEGYSELCKLAVQQNGLSITYISPNTPGYLELCKLAIQQNEYALGCISPDTPGYPELCKLVPQQDNEIIKETTFKSPDWLSNRTYESMIENLNKVVLERTYSHSLYI